MKSLQAHFAKFTGRDAAMSKSLNSDYLSQLYIRADTKSMDKDLVRDEVATSGLPDEAQALVVFKRGCVCLCLCLSTFPCILPLKCLCCLSHACPFHEVAQALVGFKRGCVCMSVSVCVFISVSVSVSVSVSLNLSL